MRKFFDYPDNRPLPGLYIERLFKNLFRSLTNSGVFAVHIQYPGCFPAAALERASDIGAGAMITCPAQCWVKAKNRLVKQRRSDLLRPETTHGLVICHDQQRREPFTAPLDGGILRASL